MVSEVEIKDIISKVLKEMNATSSKEEVVKVENSNETSKSLIEDGIIPDITAEDLREIIEIKNVENREELLKYKRNTPARLAIGRAGARYTTHTMLRLRADHASAQDAVLTAVSEDFLKENNLFTVKSKCVDKDQYITRPDLGRRLDEESVKLIKEKCTANPKVQVFVADGLSSTAIEANIEDCLPSLMNGLKSYGISVGTPFFAKLARVGLADDVSEVVGAEVTCVLIGERPGLATAESMSAYIMYKAHVGMPEAKRTVVSNIHSKGTPASEAGAHVAHIIQKVLEAKASGQDLKL